MKEQEKPQWVKDIEADFDKKIQEAKKRDIEYVTNIVKEEIKKQLIKKQNT